MTTMHTPQGRYRWTRFPFGISSAKWEVTVDYYSDFYEIDKLPTIQSSAVIQITKQHFVRHGIPHTLIADSGAQFASDLSKTFAEKNQFNHFTTSPYWSQSNGRAELLSNQQNTSCSQLTMWTQLHYPSATPHLQDIPSHLLSDYLAAHPTAIFLDLLPLQSLLLPHVTLWWLIMAIVN